MNERESVWMHYLLPPILTTLTHCWDGIPSHSPTLHCSITVLTNSSYPPASGLVWSGWVESRRRCHCHCHCRLSTVTYSLNSLVCRCRHLPYRSIPSTFVRADPFCSASSASQPTPPLPLLASCHPIPSDNTPPTPFELPLQHPPSLPPPSPTTTAATFDAPSRLSGPSPILPVPVCGFTPVGAASSPALPCPAPVLNSLRLSFESQFPVQNRSCLLSFLISRPCPVLLDNR
ncbi:hypothetical protein F5B22DRAFT_596854 [Xylaria bambusicola]|uniref:uncharacterized protein n=1 Tax=Xylaria bambusicola TaxID=326684 RepID=UPI0020080F39|nr:uncharacterized protein F5B22DRAFT_596854 [Xylaria bambusicola]KAI0521444.1 hypothetical protein F5B22DRAFT_596854 [Xylaria bambusicola]